MIIAVFIIIIWLLGIFVTAVIWRRIEAEYSWSKDTVDRGFYFFITLLWPAMVLFNTLYAIFFAPVKAVLWLYKTLAIGKECINTDK